ncbi:MAG: HAD family hydrolase [Promethearchaeota archaeon]
MQGVFFDLFGTLMIYTDSRKAWEDWLSVLYKNFKKFGLSEPKETFAIKCNGFMNKPEPNFKNLNLTIFEQRLYTLTIELNLKLRHEEIKKIAIEAINAWQKYVPLDPEVIPVLEYLKRSKTIALVSNFDHPPYIYSLLSDLRIKHFFDSIIISSEVGVKKPDPLIFKFALEQTNLKPSEVCYVGDTKEDMIAAARAKIYPILIQRKIKTAGELIYDFQTDKAPYNQKSQELEINYGIKIESLKDLINRF